MYFLFFLTTMIWPRRICNIPFLLSRVYCSTLWLFTSLSFLKYLLIFYYLEFSAVPCGYLLARVFSSTLWLFTSPSFLQYLVAIYKPDFSSVPCDYLLAWVFWNTFRFFYYLDFTAVPCDYLLARVFCSTLWLYTSPIFPKYLVAIY